VHKYLLVIIMVITHHLCFANTMQITFPKGSTTVIGTAPKYIDNDTMQQFALDQAAIFASKIDYSLCIFRFAHLGRDYDDTSYDDSATFIVNVVAYVSSLYDYLQFLKVVDERDFNGYKVNFYNLYDVEHTHQITEHNTPITLSEPEIVKTGNTVTGIGTASSSQLDIALDEAFKFALSEISKYQDINIKSMHRSVIEFSEQALLMNAENIVSDVCFSEIHMSHNLTNNLDSFTVKVLLDKVFP